MDHCPLIKNQLYVHSSGEVYSCSFLQNKPKQILGHIAQQSLSEIWNSKSRHDFSKDYCQMHQKTFLCHKIGNQHYFNDDGKLKRLDIMLDSACNLKCIMCTNIYDRTGGLKSEFFWENNDDVFGSIQELELVGGEPLISPFFARLVNTVRELNPDCRWYATTNAHYELTQEMISHLEKANFHSLSISIDSLKKEVFEKIRVRSNFEKVYNNVFSIKAIVPNIQINTVVQIDNYSELVSIYKWSLENKLRFYPILLQYPDTFSLRHLDDDLKQEWILSVMRENLTLKSKELFFFIKKLLSVDSIANRSRVKMEYLRQLDVIGEIYGG